MAKGEIKVKVLTVSTVAPAIPTVEHRMFLSNIDLGLKSFSNISMLLFYETVLTTGNEFSTIVENLKRSLSLALVDFYPFAGRFDIKEGESSRPEVDCNDGGVEFVEASIDLAFQDVKKDDFQHKNFFKELVRTRQQNYHAPLLSIQVTAFLSGGICIGANFHHVIADGNSFWHFMNCWAEYSRGLPISKKPQHMRTAFKLDRENYSIPKISFRAEEVFTDRIDKAQIFRYMQDDLLPVEYSEGNVSTADTSVTKEYMRDDMLPIEYSEINACTVDTSVTNVESSITEKSNKEKMNLEFSTFHFSEKKIQNLKERSGASTSFVAVAAQFWRCVTRARQVPEEKLVYIQLAADCRGRVKPPLPSTYFGNCISVGLARTTAKQLLEKDIRFAADLIQQLIYSCASEEQLNKWIDTIESQLGGHRENVTGQKLLSDCITDVVMSPKFAVYDIDHGWGRPLNVQAASMKAIGAMMLFAGREGGKSIAVSTQLPHHQMETLKQILMIIPD